MTAQFSEAQLERIGLFLLAVLEWEPTPPPTPPHLYEMERGEKRKRVPVS